MASVGIHHVTVVSGDAQACHDFWGGVLGLPLVKKTVNFDDPQTYHLYYGDATGSPGTLLTFFPYGAIRKGRVGRGQATAVALAVPAGEIEVWAGRLEAAKLPMERSQRRGETVLSCHDPDGLPVEIVGVDGLSGEGFVGVHSVTLRVPEVGPTRKVLETLGYTPGEQVDNRLRMTADTTIGKHVDLIEAGNTPAGAGGAGTIHHVAFRVGDDEDELATRKQMIGLGLQPTPVIDRDYFHSVYFREPGGVLFELATDPPGMAIDEEPDKLGQSLRLPKQYEHAREQIEAGIRPLVQPVSGPVFAHAWHPTPGAPSTLLALHGTGGDENDLVPLARKLDAKANVLSPRGRVDESGMPRFFRRHAEGVFDEESIVSEATALAAWLDAQAVRYGFERTAVDAVGYSNGANVAAAALLLRATSLRNLALVRPMATLDRLLPQPANDLSGHRVLLLAGKDDRIAPRETVEALRDQLQAAGADVTLEWQDAGHELTGGDLDAAKRFLKG